MLFLFSPPPPTVEIVTEDEITRAKALVSSCFQERCRLAEAYNLPSPVLEQVPPGWHEEADRRGLWKMFR